MRKKSPIKIEKMIEESQHELKVMQEDLDGQPSQNREDLKARRWSKRFAASGKPEAGAPKIRKSY